MVRRGDEKALVNIRIAVKVREKKLSSRQKAKAGKSERVRWFKMKSAIKGKR
jgi:hypothetical protein